jgi:hypothetical protein
VRQRSCFAYSCDSICFICLHIFYLLFLPALLTVAVPHAFANVAWFLNLQVRLQSVGEAARRVQSMPAIGRRPSTAQTTAGSSTGDSTLDSFEDASEGGTPRRIASAPAAGTAGTSTAGTSTAAAAAAGTQDVQQRQEQHEEARKALGRTLREELLRPAPQPTWQPPLLSQLPPAQSLKYAHGISSIPEVEGESGQSSSQASIGPPHTAAFFSDQTGVGTSGDNMSSLVTSTDVHGTCLAIIPTGEVNKASSEFCSVTEIVIARESIRTGPSILLSPRTSPQPWNQTNPEPRRCRISWHHICSF